MGKWKGTPQGKAMGRAIAAQKAREAAAARGSLTRAERIAQATGPSRAGYAASLVRQQRERFYIAFQYPGVPDGRGGWRYPKAAWPVLFKTYELASDAMALLPIFANKEATDDRPRIKSASIVKTMIR